MSFLNLFRRKAPDANTAKTSKKTILEQMSEPRPLPMGQKEFDEWSTRILSGALIPCTEPDTLKFALSSMLMQLGPHETHKPDGYFISKLRKAATNEVAAAQMRRIKGEQEAKKAAEAHTTGCPA